MKAWVLPAALLLSASALTGCCEEQDTGGTSTTAESPATPNASAKSGQSGTPAASKGTPAAANKGADNAAKAPTAPKGDGAGDGNPAAGTGNPDNPVADGTPEGDGKGEAPEGDQPEMTEQEKNELAEAEDDAKREKYSKMMGLDDMEGQALDFADLGNGQDLVVTMPDDPSKSNLDKIKIATIEDDKVSTQAADFKSFSGFKGEVARQFAGCRNWSGARSEPMALGAEPGVKFSLWCNKSAGEKRPEMYELVIIARNSNGAFDLTAMDRAWSGLGGRTIPKTANCVHNIFVEFRSSDGLELTLREVVTPEWVVEGDEVVPIGIPDPEKEPDRAKCLSEIPEAKEKVIKMAAPLKPIVVEAPAEEPADKGATP